MLKSRTIRSWYWVHKWSSLVCTAFLLMLCLTGLPLIFRDGIDAAFGHDAPTAELPESTPDTSLDRIVAAGRQRYPQEYVRSLFWDEDRPHVVNLFLAAGPDTDDPARNRFMAFDARTAQLLDEHQPSLDFMSVMLRLHEELFLDLPGELFLGLMGLLFVASIVSGVVVYGPFMRKLEFGTVRRDKSRRVRWLDLHNLLGITILLWTLVVGATGVMNTLATPLFGLWRTQALPVLLAQYRGKAMPEVAQFGSVDQAVAGARQALPGNEISSVVFPTARFGSPRHYIIWTKGQTPVTSRLFTPVLVDVQTNALTQAQGLPWYLRALEVSRPLHFGDYGGLPLKIIWALLDVVAIVVLGSGLYLWLARRKSQIEARIAEIERREVNAFETAQVPMQ